MKALTVLIVCVIAALVSGCGNVAAPRDYSLALPSCTAPAGTYFVTHNQQQNECGAREVSHGRLQPYPFRSMATCTVEATSTGAAESSIETCPAGNTLALDLEWSCDGESATGTGEFAFDGCVTLTDVDVTREWAP